MTPEKRTRLYLTFAIVGFAATIGMIAARVFEWPEFLAGFSLGLLLVAIATLLVRGLRDEYIEQLWNAGVSWAFIAVVAAFLFGPFLEGVLDGILGGSEQQDLSSNWVGPLALIAFFAGFHLKWLRTSFR